MSIIADNLNSIREELPENITLVAVSKTKPVKAILEAYNSGQKIFGENKVQEMVDKYKLLPKDIQWHMIGHLQKNKVKYMAEFVHLIHGVDSLSTLEEIDKQARKHERVINCLLQARIAQEETKFGLPFEEIEKIMSPDVVGKLENVQIVGLMGMATYTDDVDQIKKEFESLHTLFNNLKTQHSQFDTLSMGMSDDFPIAIECGSTMVRIGSAIFGAR
ncbi:MAG: YggS family pyridoxal phosphate-dependent enzyme [Flavobacteriaceae bacterium]|nr:YggS family pyridoxal phosphate-dependent enzyme [Flavobacteriaceae bacterium]